MDLRALGLRLQDFARVWGLRVLGCRILGFRVEGFGGLGSTDFCWGIRRQRRPRQLSKASIGAYRFEVYSFGDSGTEIGFSTLAG